MKKLIALILAPLCLLGLAACFPVDPGYGNTVAYAGWSDDPMIAEGALNKGQLNNENSNHLPIFKFDTLNDLEQFKTKYDGVLALDQGYNSVLSFNAALSKAQWHSEGFFKDHSLLAVYVPANSGSLRFGTHNVEVTYESVCVYVEQTNRPEIFTDDMAGWFVLVEITDEEIRNCYAFDAIFVNSENEKADFFDHSFRMHIHACRLLSGEYGQYRIPFRTGRCCKYRNVSQFSRVKNRIESDRIKRGYK